MTFVYGITLTGTTRLKSTYGSPGQQTSSNAIGTQNYTDLTFKTHRMITNSLTH